MNPRSKLTYDILSEVNVGDVELTDEDRAAFEKLGRHDEPRRMSRAERRANMRAQWRRKKKR